MGACMHACPSENRSYHLREIVRERACLVRISVKFACSYAVTPLCAATRQIVHFFPIE